MGKTLSHDIKLEIVRLHRSGEKARDILLLMNSRGIEISRGQVAYLIKNYQNGYFNPNESSVTHHTKSKISVRDIEVVRESLSSNVNQSSRDLHKLLLTDGGDISLSTTKRVIQEAGFTSDIPRYAHMVKHSNKQPRVDFCNSLITNNDTLSEIICIDESSIQLHNNKTACYRLKGNRNAALPKPKHLLKVHVWGGISRRGPTPLLIFEGIMESNFFTNNILRDTLLPFVNTTYPDGHRFQQDNDPKHRSKISRAFMADNGINWWNVWPSESPDLNPIEMVWNQLKRDIAKKEPRTKEELIDAIQTIWSTEMTIEQCNRYIDHVFKVAPVCVLMGGNATSDIPKKLLPEQSRGRSFAYFAERLLAPDVQRKATLLGL